jgi:hypothetical protein
LLEEFDVGDRRQIATTSPRRLIDAGDVALTLPSAIFTTCFVAFFAASYVALEASLAVLTNDFHVAWAVSYPGGTSFEKSLKNACELF